ncbi:hypothetical protein [Candidatus Halocynthiibacter alkanivorans]|uniref:hypothetical protein n=1 Tax=Candidatus Halocynthiibacter alkanivorans TaxID=2267619 RepID=UPI000DF21B49|nr:hypothetical protein [Candidatus Halocynthiibacter alkanivorans]
MTQKLIVAVLSFGVLAGCAGGSGGSLASLNPFNWFGASETVAVADAAAVPGQVVLQSLAPKKGYVDFTDTRPMISTVTALSSERSPDGAIIRASGVVPALGYFDAQLVKIPAEKPGQLLYQFRARPPAGSAVIGAARQRGITVAVFLTLQQLEGINEIKVLAAENARVTRR